MKLRIGNADTPAFAYHKPDASSPAWKIHSPLPPSVHFKVIPQIHSKVTP
jgi:hypothetical protein